MKVTELNFNKISPEMLIELIAARGWKKEKDFPGRATVWMDINSANPIWIPWSSELADNKKSIIEIVKQISCITAEPTDSIADELAQKYNDKDLIKFRFKGEDVTSGQIPLKDGSNAFKAIGDIFSAAVKSARHVTTEFREIYLNNATLNQTQRGSYVVSLYTPILKRKLTTDSQMDKFAETAFGRDINTNFVKRLQQIKKMAETFDESKMSKIITELLHQGFSKTEIEAIDTLFGADGHRDWEVKVLWAGENLENSETKIEFDHKEHSPVQRILAELSSVEKAARDIELVGRIVTFTRDYDDDNGMVDLKAKVKGAKESTIKLNLSSNLYHVAQEANYNKLMVKVTGKIIETKVGKRTSYFMPDVDTLVPSQNEMDFENKGD